MAFVDEQGRLFGRVNLLDAVLALLVFGAIPLAYGSYVLFRTPAPRLTAVEPATLVTGPNLRVSVKGENLRPYMRVSFNNIQGNSFIFRNVGEASIDLVEMPPGQYDVILYDYSQEQSRLPKALSILPTPLPDSQVIVVGSFGNLTAERAGELKTGMSLQAFGTVLAIGSPVPESTRVYAGPAIEIPIDKAVRVPAVIRVGCSMRAPQGTPVCVAADVALQPTVIAFVETAIGRLPFQIDQIRGAQPLEPVTVTVQLDGRDVMLREIQPGDVDQGAFANELAAGARVLKVSPPRTIGGTAAQLDATLLVQAQRDSSSWTYGSNPLRVGAPFLIRTPKYELRGTVIKVSPSWSKP